MNVKKIMAFHPSGRLLGALFENCEKRHNLFIIKMLRVLSHVAPRGHRSRSHDEFPSNCAAKTRARGFKNVKHGNLHHWQE